MRQGPLDELSALKPCCVPGPRRHRCQPRTLPSQTRPEVPPSLSFTLRAARSALGYVHTGACGGAGHRYGLRPRSLASKGQLGCPGGVGRRRGSHTRPHAPGVAAGRAVLPVPHGDRCPPRLLETRRKDRPWNYRWPRGTLPDQAAASRWPHSDKGRHSGMVWIHPGIPGLPRRAPKLGEMAAPEAEVKLPRALKNGRLGSEIALALRTQSPAVACLVCGLGLIFPDQMIRML